ncbi:MAG: hypothetical protein ACK4RV_10130 [Caulobacter sp.]
MTVISFTLAVIGLQVLLTANYAKRGAEAADLCIIGSWLGLLFAVSLAWKTWLNSRGLGLPWTVALYPITDALFVGIVAATLKRPGFWKVALMCMLVFQLCTHVVYWTLIVTGQASGRTQWFYVLISNVGFAAQLGLFYWKGIADGLAHLGLGHRVPADRGPHRPAGAGP